MKPLVYWCRWNNARLRLMGRDETAVWGELVFPDETNAFRFDLNSSVLTIQEDGRSRSLQLDEMGVETDISEG